MDSPFFYTQGMVFLSSLCKLDQPINQLFRKVAITTRLLFYKYSISRLKKTETLLFFFYLPAYITVN